MTAIRRFALVCGILALCAQGVAHARPKKSKPNASKAWVVGASVETYGGVMLGRRERSDETPVLGFAGELASKLRLHDLELSAPIGFEHRATLTADLDETQLEPALKLEYRAHEALRLEAEAGIDVVERRGWPDLYQPTADGLRSTDRYSHWDRHIGFDVTWHPVRRHWVRGGYEYTLSEYTKDPAFEPIARPNHLTPLDGLEHSAELSYRYAGRDLKLEVAFEGYVREAFFVFARDAYTGSTHASPGGPPSNPLQSLRGGAPKLEIEYELFDDAVSIAVTYQHELQEDTFAGYYTRSGPHPGLQVHWQAAKRWELSASGEMTLLTYGAKSYRAGPGHPALDSGSRRWDRKYEARLEGSHRLKKRLELFTSMEYVVRNANFPDYEPGVFPAVVRSGPGYDIDWDYKNFVWLIGLRAENRFL